MIVIPSNNLARAEVSLPTPNHNDKRASMDTAMIHLVLYKVVLPLQDITVFRGSIMTKHISDYSGLVTKSIV